MQNIDWDEVIAAYNNGFTDDIIQAGVDGKWGVIWTVAPCSPKAMERAGQQFSRSRAISIRHIRRAVLHRRDQPDQAVVVVTELPSWQQQVRDLETAEEIILRRLLSDGALDSLEAAFVTSAKEAV